MSASKKKPEELDINKTEDWARLQQQWMKTQVEKAQARADKYFASDDELPLHSHLLLLAIVSFIFVFIAWANFATLDEVTRGDGKIIPSSQIQVIQNLEGGIIDEFLVKEGDAVKADQILVRLRNIDATSNLGSNQAKYLGLLATMTRLRAEAEERRHLNSRMKSSKARRKACRKKWTLSAPICRASARRPRFTRNSCRNGNRKCGN